MSGDRAVSPACKKQVRFAEAQQTFPVVAEGYGRKCIAALESEGDASGVQDCVDLLDGVDLATLDEATVAALYEELQEPDLTDGELDFPDGQYIRGSTPTSGATRYLFFVTRYGTRYLAKIVPRYRYSYLRLKSNSVLYGTRYGTLILDTIKFLLIELSTRAQ